MSVGAIILVPWLFHDVRFILLVPMTFLVVPGLFGVLLKATGELVSILAESRRKEKEALRRREKERAVEKRRFHRRRKQHLWVSAGAALRTATAFAREFAAFWRGFV